MAVRSNCWSFVLYPDDPIFPDVYRKLMGLADSYWAVQHDSDKKDDGSLKKIHIHFIAKFPFSSSFKSLSELLSLPNGFEPVKNLRASLRYLIHLDNPDKAQYNPDSVCTNNVTQLHKAFTEQMDMDDAVLSFLVYLEENPFCSWSMAVKWCIQSGFGALLRSSGYFMKSLWSENSRKGGNNESSCSCG